ncbi:MAG TPA: hypothetical protein VFE47_15780 [Tepidisphaeraceae bacterium]|jgi:hypothetical protein|nr:hypothetical protein [Tepidisphaeraceae bacterium]
MAVMIAARINGRVIADANDSSKAEALAESAIEYALQTIANDPNWRADYPNALPIGPLNLGDGAISFTIVDDIDGNLTNNTYDSIRIYGTGTVRNARKIYSVRCTTKTPLDCLQTAVSIGGPVSFTGTTLSGAASALFASNTGISANSVTFSGGLVLSAPANTVTINAPAGSTPAIVTGTRQLPDPAHAFDYYLANATAISISALPISNGNSMLQLAVLSPASNPFGQAVNPQGIYVIDCQGQTLQIANMRIVGTLIVLNPGPGSGVFQSNYIAPAVANFPSLLVRGDFTLAASISNLVDNAATGNAQTPAVNYNPPGTPYLGTSDTTCTTAYPSRIDGILYISGNVAATNSPSINGVLIANGSFTQTGGSLTLSPGTSVTANPPPGFTSQVVVPMGGTWQWEKGTE